MKSKCKSHQQGFHLIYLLNHKFNAMYSTSHFNKYSLDLLNKFFMVVKDKSNYLLLQIILKYNLQSKKYQMIF